MCRCVPLALPVLWPYIVGWPIPSLETQSPICYAHRSVAIMFFGISNSNDQDAGATAKCEKIAILTPKRNKNLPVGSWKTRVLFPNSMRDVVLRVPRLSGRPQISCGAGVSPALCSRDGRATKREVIFERLLKSGHVQLSVSPFLVDNWTYPLSFPNAE